MTFDLVLKDVAVRQAAEIYAYYEAKRPGLGERFIGALVEGYGTLRQNPFFQMRKTPYRYLKLRRFPYRLVYEVLDNTVVIYQVRHTSRRPSKKFGP